MASRARDVLMLSVGERLIEAFQSRKRLYLATPSLNIGVADRAHRAARCLELFCVTPRARRVSHGTNRLRRIGLSAMAQQTREPLMTRIVM